MFKVPFILLVCLTMCFSAIAKDPYFHQVPARSGDNIYKLLQRYRLEKADCNYQQFYQLNKLNSESRLIADKYYHLPVLIYHYNGSSIRTTLGIDTWEQALRIKHYNEYLKQNKLRQQTIEDSKILWVPYHELNCEGGVKRPTEKTLEIIIGQEIVKIPSSDEKALSEAKNEAIASSEVLKTRRINVVENPKNLMDHNKLEPDERLSGYRKFPIFGKKYAHIPQLDNKLRGKVFYVVSGHGGPDSGAIGKRGNKSLYEDEYAYDVSLRVVRHLLSHGAIAYMITRDPNDGLRDEEYLEGDRDEYCWGNYKIPRQQKTRLFQRSDAINTLYERHKAQGIKDQTVMCIHIDSRNTSQNTDVFFYYFPGSKKGRQLAKKLHGTFKQKYKKYRSDGRYHGTISARDLHMLREVKPNSVFIELGNIRNRHDQQRFLMASNREALAKWLYEGLIK